MALVWRFANQWNSNPFVLKTYKMLPQVFIVTWLALAFFVLS